MQIAQLRALWLVQFANIEIFYKSFIKVLDITIIKVYYDINNKRNTPHRTEERTTDEPSAADDLRSKASGNQLKRKGEQKNDICRTDDQGT